MKFLSRFRMTFIAMLLAIGLVAAGKFLKLNIVNLENLISMDASSIDDVVAGLFLIILGVSVDSAMLRQRLSLEHRAPGSLEGDHANRSGHHEQFSGQRAAFLQRVSGTGFHRGRGPVGRAHSRGLAEIEGAGGFEVGRHDADGGGDGDRIPEFGEEILFPRRLSKDLPK